MFEAGMEFIFELIPRSARTAPCGVTALRHEVGDHAVEHHTFIISFARQEDEVVHGLRSLVCKQLDDHGALIGLHVRLVVLLGVDLHLGWFRPLFCHWVSLLMFLDRKSTRLNSSHMSISYAVF